MYEVTILYRDGTKAVHTVRKESQAKELARTALSDPTVVKAVYNEVE